MHLSAEIAVGYWLGAKRMMQERHANPAAKRATIASFLDKVIFSMPDWLNPGKVRTCAPEGSTTADQKKSYGWVYIGVINQVKAQAVARSWLAPPPVNHKRPSGRKAAAA